MTVELHYQIHGEGKPLLILHGLFGSSRNWSGIARELSNDHQVITIDLRNHGASGHSDTMSYLEMAEDIAQLAASLGHESIRILGHSMGGKAAMVLSLLKPSLVEQLIVVDIAPASYLSNHDDLIAAMQSLPIAEIENRMNADQNLAHHVNDPVLRQFLLQNLIRHENAFKWRINLDAIQQNHSMLRDFPDELKGKRFDKPTLFLSGGLSDYIQTDHHKTITAYFPESRHIVIDDARHWVHADKPEEVIKEVTRFLI